MNNFILGAFTAFLTLTPQGNKLAADMGKIGGKMVKNVAKKNGLDLNALLDEPPAAKDN